MSDLVLAAGRVLQPAVLPGPGWVRVAGGTLTAVGAGIAPPGALDLGPEAVIAPGLVDMHVHGGGGHAMTTGRASEMAAALRFHLERGTTASVISLVTASLPALEAGLDAVRAVPDLTPVQVLGSHLEGPFLSAERRGAHPAALLVDPTPELLQRLLSAADGTLRMITLAPERDGALAAIGALRSAGVVVAVGHTDADHDLVRTAISRGASVGTHLFNGMRGLHHRCPGPPAALLDDERVVCELINDGVHVHPTVARLVADRCRDGRLALITDAVAATGAPDGRYELGAATVVRAGGEIRLADGSSLGGSDLCLADAVRRAVHVLGLDLPAAVAAATVVPARALGVAHRVGTLAAGRSADLVVLDGNLSVTAVMVRGEWIRHPVESERISA